MPAANPFIAISSARRHRGAPTGMGMSMQEAKQSAIWPVKASIHGTLPTICVHFSGAEMGCGMGHSPAVARIHYYRRELDAMPDPEGLHA